MARVSNYLKRFEFELSSKLIFDNLIINKENYEVIYNNISILMPRKEFDLLFLLASKPGKVYNRDEILNKVWGNEVYVGDRTIDVHVRKIREKINEDYIQTVKGVGYKFNWF